MHTPIPLPAAAMTTSLSLPEGIKYAMSAWFLGRKQEARRSTASAASAPAQVPPPVAAPAQAASLAVLAVALRSPHGASPGELAAAIAAGKARPDLDRELVDPDGFPIMTARCRTARDEALQEDIGAWMRQGGFADLALNDERWRALVLATGVVLELADHAAARWLAHERAVPMLALLPVLPGDWSSAQHHVAGLWLQHAVTQAGWPAERIATTVSAAEPDATAALFGRLSQITPAPPGAPSLAMIVACASQIGDATVALRSADRTLFTAAHPQGAIPGEGAVGLLLADVQQARSTADAAFAVLAPPAQVRRPISADVSRRIDPAQVGAVVERVLGHAGLQASDIAMIVVDAGHRSNRMLELMGHVSPAMPQLDGAEDIVGVGQACGTCDAVPFFTALALAHHHALERQSPVLCIANADPYQRVAALFNVVSNV